VFVCGGGGADGFGRDGGVLVAVLEMVGSMCEESSGPVTSAVCVCVCGGGGLWIWRGLGRGM
jgi:hypothetical protein